MEDEGERPLLSPSEEYADNSDEEEVVPSYKPHKRRKTGSRVYYTVVLLWVFLLLLLAGISLGSFGLRQSKITNFYSNDADSKGHCILYVSLGSVDGSLINLNFLENFGLCAFVFWGLASLNIVAFSFIIYLVVLIVVGPKVLTSLRILELFVSMVTVLGAFVLSAIITAGISKTCGAIKLANSHNSCSKASLIRHSDPNNKMYFYDEVIVAQNSCWIATLFWFAFCVWNLALTVIYMKQQRRTARNEGVI